MSEIRDEVVAELRSARFGEGQINYVLGNSTRAEIKYAESKGKPVKYLEALKESNGK